MPIQIVLALLAAADPAGAARARYDAALSGRLVPLLCEAIGFATVEGNAAAHAAQKAWLARTARDLGFSFRDAGTVSEIDLPGPPGAPVLGLVVHGDVQPVEDVDGRRSAFACAVENGVLHGRGAADDKGPLVQALLAMRALADAGPPRSHAIRLLVGSDEESGGNDVKAYLAANAPPRLALVLDSEFPVVVGEKAWNALRVWAANAPRGGPARPWEVVSATAGVAPSIVPDRARLALRWREGEPDWEPLLARLRSRPMPDGTRLEVEARARDLAVTVHGRAGHAGVSLESGRNALVALAFLVDGELPVGPAADLLALARLAGQDLHGTGLGLTRNDPVWGRYAVNVAQLGPDESKGGRLQLVVNLRRPPPLTGPQLREHLARVVADLATRRGAALEVDGYFDDEPLAFDPAGKLVLRLRAAYRRATGRDDPPAVSGGGTYAKRLPDAIAFGMWFPGKPYTGHSSDERIDVADLHRGVHVLLEALADLASGPPMERPLEP